MVAYFIQSSYHSQLLKCCPLVFESILWTVASEREYLPPMTYFGTKAGVDRDIPGCGTHMEVTLKAV